MNLKIYPSDVWSFTEASSSTEASHMISVIAAMCRGVTKIENINLCDDVIITLDALRQMGAGVMYMHDGVLISGIDMFRAVVDEHIVIDVKGSFTSLCLLLPLATYLYSAVTFKIQNPRIHRLMAYYDIFTQQGLYFDMGEDYITASGRLESGEYKSIYPITFPEFDGLLLLAPYFTGRTDIYYEKDNTSVAYLTYTTEYMEEFRVRSLVDNDSVQIAGRQKYFTEGRIKPESDWLKAAQFLIFGVIKGRTGIVGFKDDKMVRPEVSILDILRKCDVKINESEDGFFVESSFIPPFTIDLSGYACFLPVICVMAAFSEGYCIIKGADRYGDYDALSGFVYELRKADVNIGFTEEGDIAVKGGRVYFGCEFDNYNDAVITAALSIFSACAVTESVISNFGIINRWYPDFIDDMRNAGISVE